MKSIDKMGGGFLLAAALLNLIYASPACAGLWGRAKLQADWAEKAVSVDGVLSDWPAGANTCEKDGLRFNALNDGTNFYISVSAHESSAKMVLSGQARQDVVFWFLASKTRTAGLRLPFGKLGVPEGPGIQQPSEPEFLTSDSGIIPSTTMPKGVELGSELTGRYPAYELKMPLDMLQVADGRVLLDFETSYASADVKKKMQEKLVEAGKRVQFQDGKGSGTGNGPRGMRGGGGMPGGGMPPQGAGGPPHGGPGGSGSPELPDTITVKLMIILNEHE